MGKVLTRVAAEHWGTLLGVVGVIAVWARFGLNDALRASGACLLVGAVSAMLQVISATGLFRAIGRTFRQSWRSNETILELGPLPSRRTEPRSLKPRFARLRFRLAVLTLWAIAVIPFASFRQPILLAVLIGLLVIFGAITGAFVHLLDGLLRSLIDGGNDAPGHPPSDGSPVPAGGGPRAPKPLVARAKPRLT